MFLTPELFNITYPLGDKIGQGSHGIVYESGIHVVKTVTADLSIAIRRILMEIDIYTKIDHPCIAKMEAWTIERVKGKYMIKLAILKGEYVTRYHLNFYQMLGDILSGILILKKIGISHNDIKIHNTIYHNGHIRLIDFGIASPILLYQNGDFIQEPTNTVSHRDPIISFTETNGSTPVIDKTELYSVGAFMLESWSYMNINDYENYPLTQDTMFDLTFKNNTTETEILKCLVRHPPESRPTIEELFSMYPKLRRTEGTVKQTPFQCNEYDIDDADVQLHKVAHNLMKITERSGNKVRTLFHSMDMFHRTLPLLVDPDVGNIKNSTALTMVCLFLSQVILKDAVHTIHDYAIAAQIGTNQLEDMVVDVIVFLKGDISHSTPWDYAESYEDTLCFFKDLLSKNYNPDTVPISTGGTIDKNQTVSKFVKDIYISSQTLNIDRRPSTVMRSVSNYIPTIKIDYSVVKSVFDLYFSAVKDYDDNVEILEVTYQLFNKLVLLESKLEDITIEQCEDLRVKLNLFESGKRVLKLLK
jgi:serine/threonine protein kinase